MSGLSAWVRHAAPGAGALLAILALWWVTTASGAVQSFLLPGPGAVLSALFASAASGELLPNVAYTLGNLLLGYAIGAAIGIAAGLGLAKSPRAERALGGPILFVQTAPKIALAPLFLIWFGLGLTSKIVLIVSLVVFPVLVGTLTGLRGMDAKLADLARLLRLGAWQRFRRIEWPAALPEIFVGLRIGAVQALVGAILAEYISGQTGLGYLMVYASSTYRTPLLFGAVVLTIALGLGVYAAVSLTEARLLRWRDAR